MTTCWQTPAFVTLSSLRTSLSGVCVISYRILFSSARAAVSDSRCSLMSVEMGFDCLFFFLVLLQPSVLGSLTVTPLNQVVSVGGRVTFRCQTNITKRLTWSHIAVGTQLQMSNKIRNRFSVNSTNSSIYHFTIESVNLEDAGVHAWSDDDGFGTPFGIDLVVIPYGPSCVTNVTTDAVTAGDAISIVCIVAYRGNMKPVGKWIDPGSRNSNASEGDISNVDDEKVFRRLTTVDATQGRRQVHRFRLAFKARDKDPRMFAVNDIDDVYSWTSPEVSVMFPASNVQVNITGGEDVIAYFGERVTCSAEGNPEVQLHWKEIDVTFGKEGSIGAGPHLSLNESGRHRYQCIAENVIGNETHRSSKNISVKVLHRIQSTQSQPANPLTDDGRTSDFKNDDAERSLGTKSTKKYLRTFSSAFSVNPEYVWDTATPTDRTKLLNETTLLFLTVVLGSILLAAIVVFFVACFIIRRKTRHKKLTSKEHYLTVAASSERKYTDEYECHRESRVGYNNCRKSDIYEEINESEVIDESQQEVHLEEPGNRQMSSIATPRYQDSADDEMIAMESSYITCPATLLTS